MKAYLKGNKHVVVHDQSNGSIGTGSMGSWPSMFRQSGFNFNKARDTLEAYGAPSY